MNAGAAVVGPKPIDSPSLSDDQAEFQTIASQLWGPETGEQLTARARFTPDRLWRKRWLRSRSSPTSNTPSRSNDTSLLFVHRKLADGESVLGG